MKLASYCVDKATALTGMAAISAVLMSLCDAGDHIVSGNAVYGKWPGSYSWSSHEKCLLSVSFRALAALLGHTEEHIPSVAQNALSSSPWMHRHDGFYLIYAKGQGQQCSYINQAYL
jgi:hypothetical protein